MGIAGKLAAAVVLSVGAALLIATPTLNLDDLSIVPSARGIFVQHGLWGALATALLNTDLPSEVRTYGLARAVQLVLAAARGPSPAGAYATMVLVHFASACLVYRLLEPNDRSSACLAAVAWAASPAVLPMLKVEHHWLYLIAPYYALIAWVLVMRRPPTRLRDACGAGLLIATWWLGEGVVPALVAVPLVVGYSAWRAGDVLKVRVIVMQLAISLLALGVYLAFNLAVVHRADEHSRFVAAPSLRLIDLAHRLAIFVDDLWQTVRGAFGLPYFDYDIGMPVGGYGAIDLPSTWFLAAGLAAIFLLSMRRSPIAPACAGSAPLIAMTACAPLVFLAVALFTRAASPAPRYYAGFMVLAPVAVIAAAGLVSPRLGRLAAAPIAALLLAIFFVALVQAERLVSAPNRALIAELRARAASGQTTIVLPTAVKDGSITGTSSGFVPIDRYGLTDPFRSAWTTIPAAALYAAVRVEIRPQAEAPRR